MDKPIVIGIGEFLWDVLPGGKKAGGAPVNFAYHASRNGADGWAVSAVGDDELGRELLEETKAHGINMAVKTVPYPTGTVNVKIVDGQPDYSITENVAWDHIEITAKAKDLASKAKAICFGTLAQRSEQSRLATEELIKCAPSDALIIYDINLRQHYYDKDIVNKSLMMANVLKINDEEIEKVKTLFGLEGMGADEICNLAMKKYNLKMVILTAGSKWSSVYSPEGKSSIDTPTVEVVDTVGAGDAFTGALVGSLLSGKTIAQAHLTAVETAAYVCTQAGAWTPYKHQ